MEVSGKRCDPGEGAIIKEAVWYQKRSERFEEGKKEINSPCRKLHRNSSVSKPVE
jgi:hypothetical protein